MCALIVGKGPSDLYGSKIFQNDLVRVKLDGLWGGIFLFYFLLFGLMSIFLVHPRDMTNLYGSKIFQNYLVRVKIEGTMWWNFFLFFFAFWSNEHPSCSPKGYD